jgi:hypothetical protein
MSSKLNPLGGQEMDRLLMTQADCGIIGGLLFDDG